ncbi:MAG: ArnT family glycosyltransferase [Candidatus Nanohaloarchaea archaeon]
MDRKLKYILLLILAFGFVIRLAPVRLDYHYWDEAVYLQHAQIIDGKSPNNYNEFDFRPPLFPLLLAPVMLATSSIAAIHVWVSLLSTLGILVTYWLADDLFDKKTAVAASLIYTVSPLAATISHDILVDPVLPVFWLSTAFFMNRYLETARRKYSALTGITAALAVLMKFTSFLIIPAIVLSVLFYRSEKLDDLLSGEFYLDLFRDRSIWYMKAGFLLTFLPYLLWNYLSYGSPIFVFQKAIRLSGATDPFMTYVMGFGVFLLPTLYIGVLLYFTDFEWSHKDLMPLVFLLCLYIPLQFWLGNKEHRFLMPVIPFLSIISARGFMKQSRIFEDRDTKKLAAVIILVILSLPLLFTSMSDRNPLKKGLTVDQWHPPIENGISWLKQNTPENTTLYTNSRWPVLAYGTKRDTVVIPAELARKGSMKKVFDSRGYLYMFETGSHVPEIRSFMDSSQAFRTVKIINQDEAIYLYTGE